MARDSKQNRYVQILEDIFRRKHKRGMKRVAFTRDEIIKTARKLRIPLPKNLGDLIYTFRFRSDIPEAVALTAPKGTEWIIRLAGRGAYCFAASALATITPRPGLAIVKVPDATPGIIARYALSDEQALLAKLRYNRLIDVFTGLACYPLQSHLRTTVEELGQVETDEIYVGLDRSGAHFVLPVQAKGGSDRQSIVQIEQDIAVCSEKFPNLICLPIAAQFMADDVITMFSFQVRKEEPAILEEKHYQLVPQEDLSEEELRSYRRSLRRAP